MIPAIDRPYLDLQQAQAKVLRAPTTPLREVMPVVTVDAIVASVAAIYSVTAGEIWGHGRERPIAKARHEVWRRMRSDLGWSYPMIGKRFGVQHSTVLRALGGNRGAETWTNASAETHQGTGRLATSFPARPHSRSAGEAEREQPPAGRETERELASIGLDVGTARAERSAGWSREMLTSEQATGYLEARLREAPKSEACQINSTTEDDRKGSPDAQ